jgi:SAM-dependent methyltransferase
VSEVTDRFDVVIASEVLEHCEDDVGFLQQLKERIVPGGWLLLTVPAHMSKWGANDDFCGHLRRYERAEIAEKIGRAGLELKQVCSYGVPLYNLMKPLYDRAIARRMQHGEAVAERTRKSGGMWLFKRLSLLFRLLFNDFTLTPFYVVQRLFFSSELGNGYFIAARAQSDEGPAGHRP